MVPVLNPVFGAFFRPQHEALGRYSEHRRLTHLGFLIAALWQYDAWQTVMAHSFAPMRRKTTPLIPVDRV